MAVQTKSEVGCLGVEVSRSHTIRHTHTHRRWGSPGRAISSSQRPLPIKCITLTKKEDTCYQRDSNPRVLGTKGLQTHTVDHTATGIATCLYWQVLHCENFNGQHFYSRDFMWKERYRYSMSVAVCQINTTHLVLFCVADRLTYLLHGAESFLRS